MKSRLRWLGNMGYNDAWEIQKQTHAEVLEGAPDTLLLVEHFPVITLGAGFHEQNLLASAEVLKSRGIEVVTTDRGGDITYHGTGQLTIYPIFDLNRHGKDLHLWLRNLEETMLKVIANYGLKGRRFPPHTGAWIGDRKVAAIGVKIKKWTSLHGVALNCNMDLTPFSYMIPCGIQHFGVTTLSMETGRDISVRAALGPVVAAFEQTFALEFDAAELPIEQS